MTSHSDDKLLELQHDVRSTLHASFLTFIRYFYPLLTGREFMLSAPLGRESHFITLARAFTYCFRNPATRLDINLPPGYGKTTMAAFWIAWCMARFPDSRFLYISYGLSIATQAVELARRIVQLKEYGDIFGVYVRHDARGKEKWQTVQGGAVCAFGSSGAITGHDAGYPNLNRFSGAVIIDDAHKPDEAHSDTVRESVIRNYHETIQQRPRGINVPIIVIGQRVHELDLPGHLLAGGDGMPWDSVILKALDDAGNALYPEKDPLDRLLIKQEKDIYTFASQYQQEPQPSGGSLFKQDYFPLLSEEPKCLSYFITVDGAETSKSYNDATVFSYFGVYKINDYGFDTDMWALHWIDCHEIRVEPYQLQGEFDSFVHRCFNNPHHGAPQFAAVEKKSTGVTLLSVLQQRRGLEIRAIERNGGTKDQPNSKSERFISMQHYIAGRQVSLPAHAPHTPSTLEHMRKITANQTHAHDDRCDTLYDAIKYAFIDKGLILSLINKPSLVGKSLAADLRLQVAARNKSYYEQRL